MGTDKVIFVGEQWGATGSHGTGRGHVRNRKSSSTSIWLPVTEGVEGRAHAQPEVVQYPLVGPFHRKLATGSDVIFPAYFS